MPTSRRLAALLLLTVGAPASAQIHAPAAARPVRLPAPAAAPADAPSTGRLVAGGLLGGAVGALVGGGAGAAIGGGRDCDAERWVCALHGAMAGAAIGTSVGIPWGTHLAGGRRGPVVASTLASLAIGAAGVAVMRGSHYDPPWTPVALVATPVAQLVVSAALERRGR